MHGIGVKQTQLVKALIAYFIAIKEAYKNIENGLNDKIIKREIRILKSLIKGRKQVFTRKKMKDMKDRKKSIDKEIKLMEKQREEEKKEKAVRELLESMNIPINQDIIDDHVDGINNLMDLDDQYETFEEALEAWTSYSNFDDINNKRRGGKKKKKKKKTRRKSNKNKKKKKKKKNKKKTRRKK